MASLGLERHKEEMWEREPEVKSHQYVNTHNS